MAPVYLDKENKHMIVKKIKYTDYNGVEREEEFYFNLDKAELFNLSYGTVKGGLEEAVKAMIRTDDTPALIKIFEDIILSAYGEKSADGKRFVKSDEAREAFRQTPAYSELLMGLLDEQKAADFIGGLVPQAVANEMLKLQENNENATDN